MAGFCVAGKNGQSFSLLVGARSAPTTIFCVVFVVCSIVVLYTIGGRGEVKFSLRIPLSRYLECPSIFLKYVESFFLKPYIALLFA
jgi:hypothetical protein